MTYSALLSGRLGMTSAEWITQQRGRTLLGRSQSARGWLLALKNLMIFFRLAASATLE